MWKVCYGHIQGEYPIFVPRESKLVGKLVEEAHIQTIHGEMTLIMAKVRSKYRISTLRQLVERVLRQCYKCKEFHVKSYPVPLSERVPERVSERVVDKRPCKFRFPIQNHG